jgi:hypothetical protein
MVTGRLYHTIASKVERAMMTGLSNRVAKSCFCQYTAQYAPITKGIQNANPIERNEEEESLGLAIAEVMI